jgi:hypothetical protein
MTKDLKNQHKKVVETEKIAPKVRLEEQKSWISSPYFAIAVFLLTTMIFFAPQLFGNAYFWEDFLEYIYPTQTLAAKEFAKGMIPFWNPYTLSGMPFLADIQVGFFYPFNRIMGLFLNSNGMLPIWVVQFIAIMHFFIAQINYYIFARYLKISFWGAILGAISYSFAFTIVLHVIHPMIVFHLAWFPLIFYFFKKALDNHSIKNGAIAGLIFGITMLSGHPQVTFYFAFILGIYFLWVIIPLIFKRNSNNQFLNKTLLAGILTFILAVGIFMIQFLPTNELAKYSVRSVTSYEKSSENSLQFKQVFTLIQPKLFGYYEADNQTNYPISLTDEYDGKETPVKNYFYWETAMYFGIFPLVFGLLGIFVAKKDNFKWYLITIIIFGFLYALGKYFPLHKLFYYLPYFGTFRNPVRMFTFSVFGLSLFTGFAFDFISENFKNKIVLKNFLIISGSVLIIALLSQIGILQSIVSVPSEFASISSSMTITPLIITLLLILLGWLYIQKILNVHIAGILFAILLFVDLYSQGASFTQSKNNIEAQYIINPQLKDLLKAQPTKDIFRVKTRIYSPSYMAVKRNQGMIDELYMLEGYNPLVLKLATVPFPWDNSLQLQNVKYDLKIDSLRGSVSFYQRTNMLGPAWLVSSAKYVPDDSCADYFYQNPTDFSKEVLVNQNDINLSKYNSVDSLPLNLIQCIEYTENEQKFNVNSPKPTIMVFSEIYYPEWEATIDGNQVPVILVNHSLRAIEMPVGKHQVVMKYSTKQFNFGAIVSSLSLLSAIILIVAFRKEK